MTHAARTGTLFHLWWHPHNFGADLDASAAFLRQILAHYRDLGERYGMRSLTVGELAEAFAPERDHGAPRPAGG